MSNIPNIDLNLLKLFAVLYETGSVTQSAQILHMSQSACSHALTRLRERLNDELFVRVNNQMLATNYAHRLADEVLPALNVITQGLKESKDFDPADNHRFTIAATDYTAWCLKPFLSDLLKQFSNISVQVIQLEQRIPTLALKELKLDIVCGFEHKQEKSESLAQLDWFEGEYVTLCCQHTKPPLNLTMKEFLRRDHVLIAPWNESRGIVDRTLAQQKKVRRVILSTPHMLSAPVCVQDTDWLLTMPAKYAKQIAPRMNLAIHSPPLKVPNYHVKLYWYRTRHHDPKLQWFIEQFRQFHNLN
ncbi:LysR family transcriptional regulator [Pseudoalteromonas luteoviolacea]|uniref:LysR family transcriptional regulator n=1 Tax=Pseudoalteromonas luteoviolacea TaxID=43657 RepID=UPI001B399345|nr:LysR family transcriptional regulator [Pseudoalteromonas luteoviolacea]MBQ4813277.1 LysR family transcriptional regulator [Pseudoalteromonas luteoviolacea]